MGRLHWVAQWLRLYAPNAGGLGSIPSQGTRSYMPQVRIPHATTKMEISVFHKKTQHSQINKDRKKKKKTKHKWILKNTWEYTSSSLESLVLWSLCSVAQSRAILCNLADYRSTQTENGFIKRWAKEVSNYQQEENVSCLEKKELQN